MSSIIHTNFSLISNRKLAENMPSATRSIPMIEQHPHSVIDFPVKTPSVIEQRDPDLECSRTVDPESHAKSSIANNNSTDEDFDDQAHPSNPVSSSHSPQTVITNPSTVSSAQTPDMPEQHPFHGHGQGVQNQVNQSKSKQVEQRQPAHVTDSDRSDTHQTERNPNPGRSDRPPPHLRDLQPRPQANLSSYQHPHLRPHPRTNINHIFNQFPHLTPAHPRQQNFRRTQNAPHNRQTSHQYMAVSREGPSTSERVNSTPHDTPLSNYVPHNRPVPNHRRELDHQVNRSQPHIQARDGQQKNKWRDPFPFQVHFLEKLAAQKVPKVEMGLADLTAREDLRQILQGLCRDTIAQHELKQREDFDPETVQLKCFGSLGSGLATLSSDLDLAIMSPDSVPECSSVESEIPRLLEKRLLDAGFGARLLTQTRVPIIKFCREPTPELAKALLEERAKWERERDSPPKPEETKDQMKPTTDLAEIVKNDGKARQRFRRVSDRYKPRAGEQKKHQEQLDTIPENTATTTPKNEEVDAQNHVVRSDEELVFLYNQAILEGWYDVQERKTINNFLTAVTKQESALDRARLQVARLELDSVTDILHRYRAPRNDPLNFPKEGVGIQCDINFSNHLALHNTTLLKCYSLCDPRIRPMIVFVKAWAKSRKINSPYHGTLPSYGYVLMALHYLINIADPPIAPNLQRIGKAAQDNSPENDEVIDGYGVRFWRSTDEIERLAEEGVLTRNTKDSVGSLLHGFFYYFAHEGFWSPAGGFNWARDVLSLRSQRGTLIKQSKGWTQAKTVIVEPSIPGREAKEIRHRYLMAIEDPFETDHNIARTVVYPGLVAIRDEFRRAHAIIDSIKAEKNSVPVDDLFAEAKDRERYFGPLVSKEEVEIQRKKALENRNKDKKTPEPPSNTEPVTVQRDQPPPGPSFKEKYIPVHKKRQIPGHSSGRKPIIHNDEPIAKSISSNTSNQGERSLSLDGEIVPANNNSTTEPSYIEVGIGANSDNSTAGVSSDTKRGSSNKGKLPARSALKQAQQILNAQAKALPGQSQLSVPMVENKDQLESKLLNRGKSNAFPNKEELGIEGVPGSSTAETNSTTLGEKQLSANDAIDEAEKPEPETLTRPMKRRIRSRKYHGLDPSSTRGGSRSRKNIEVNVARKPARIPLQHAKPTEASVSTIPEPKLLDHGSTSNATGP